MMKHPDTYFTFGSSHTISAILPRGGTLADYWVRVSLPEDYPISPRRVFVEKFTEIYCPNSAQFAFEYYGGEKLDKSYFRKGELCLITEDGIIEAPVSDVPKDKIDLEKEQRETYRKQREAIERSTATYEAKRDAERRAFKAAGGHAYPTPDAAYAGMTLRQHYAGLAMQTLVGAFSANGMTSDKQVRQMADAAVFTADMLLHALKEKP
jgi:hypothetical protein